VILRRKRRHEVELGRVDCLTHAHRDDGEVASGVQQDCFGKRLVSKIGLPVGDHHEHSGHVGGSVSDPVAWCQHRCADDLQPKVGRSLPALVRHAGNGARHGGVRAVRPEAEVDPRGR